MPNVRLKCIGVFPFLLFFNITLILVYAEILVMNIAKCIVSSISLVNRNNCDNQNPKANVASSQLLVKLWINFIIFKPLF